MKLVLVFFTFMFFISVVQGDVVPAKNSVLKNIEWKAPADIKSRFGIYFQDLKGKPWDVLSFKIKIDQISKELFNYGYFASIVKTEFMGTDNDVVARVSIDPKERTNFQFQGNKIFSNQDLRSKLVDKIKNDLGKNEPATLSAFISECYEDIGFYNTKVTSYQNQGVDSNKRIVRTTFFVIDEGEKLPVSNISFRGNFAMANTDLIRLYKENASSLALAGYYDKLFFENFSEIIKKYYLSKGFVFVDVTKPRVVTSEEDESLTVEYGITEKQQVYIKKVDFKNIDSSLQSEVKSVLVNRVGTPLNVIELESDLRKAVNFFQNKGYYFATISNLNGDSLLTYDKGFNWVDITPQIALDKKICFNEAIVNGNLKTNSEVVTREVELKAGEIITPAKLESIRQRLAGLGLFSSLRLSPYMIYDTENADCAKTNLVIQVKEKDFGLGEVAPGYRTDLGAKLSTGITYNNLMGMNRTLSFKAQMNQRFNLAGFDDRRRTQNIRRLEHSSKITFIEPYLLHNLLKSQVELEVSSSFQRKRFYGFDADIFKFSPQISKNFTKNFSTSIRYQFERINQFDATVVNDNDNFSIGGVTPSVTLDLRDDAINPRKGSYFTLSSEWANNYFGSMKNADLEVNYVKLINRNKFYVPIGNFTLAFSLAMGFEKNFSTELLKDDSGNPLLNSNGIPRTHGYIPSIKVFRLDGYDEIRGFEESEINRLIDGTPIGNLVIQNTAYFAAFKFEPRFNLTDSLQLGVFYDAGRVFVDHFQPLKLRSAVGAGLKFLTPVGSLDFDYGIKLTRHTYPDGKRDSAGRFLLSIGFF